MGPMKLAFNAVFPLLAFMVAGYFLRRRGMLDEKTSAGMNKLVFKVFLPLSIFQSFYGSAIGMTAVLIIVITLIVNICSTIAFESARGGSASLPKMIKRQRRAIRRDSRGHIAALGVHALRVPYRHGRDGAYIKNAARRLAADNYLKCRLTGPAERI